MEDISNLRVCSLILAVMLVILFNINEEKISSHLRLVSSYSYNVVKRPGDKSVFMNEGSSFSPAPLPVPQYFFVFRSNYI